MGFVDDQRGQVVREPLHPVGPRECLDRGDDHGSGNLIEVGLHDADVVRHEPQLVNGLAYQLVTVDEDERPAPAPADQFREDERLPGAGGENDELATHPARLPLRDRR